MNTDFLPAGFTETAFLGEGSMNKVLAVRRETDGSDFALKISKGTDPARRLEREFAILERVEVDGVVKVYEFGEHDGSIFFIMELVRGVPFTEFMSRRRANPDFVDVFFAVFQRAASILSKLHKQGIVHVDLKPANLLVKDDGKPVLLDFGFAEDFMLSPTSEPSGTTLDYAAPELFTGGYASPAADIYSLGAIGYETLRQSSLWGEKSPRELIRAKLKTPPGLGTLEFDLPPGLEDMLIRMLSPEPSLRPSAEEIILEIDWLLNGVESYASGDFEIPLPRLIFGGRDEEIAELERLLFKENRVVHLSGESGTGKTRILRELRFRSLLNDRSALLLEGRGAHLSLVDHISASLGIKHEENQDKWQRFERVYRGICEFGFKAILLDSPLALSSDEKEFLGYLARGFDSKIGMLLSQTPTDVYPGAARVELGKLDKKKVEALIKRTFEGLKDYEKLAEDLVSTAGGTPRRMNELLEILHEEGWLAWRRGWLYEPGKEDKTLAERLEAWLYETLSRLDENAKLVLNLLSTVDSGLSADVLTKIMGDSAALELKELMTKGLIRSFLYLGIPHYEFGNDIIKPYLLTHLSEEEKKKLALVMAEALEEFAIQIWGEDLEEWSITYVIQTGLLFTNGGGDRRAIRYMISAGKKLVLLGDPEKAYEILMLALNLKLTTEEKLKIYYQLGDIATNNHNPIQAEGFFLKALSFSENTPEEKTKALLRISFAYLCVVDIERMAVFLKESEMHSSQISSTLKGRQLHYNGWLLLLRGQTEEAKPLFVEAEKLLVSPAEKRSAFFGLASISIRLGRMSEALIYMKKAIEKSREEGKISSVCVYTAGLSTIFYGTGSFDEVEKCIEESLLMVEGIKSPRETSEVLLYKVVFLHYSGQYREGLNLIRKAMRISEKIGDKHRLTTLRWREAQFLESLGDWKASEKAYSMLWKDLHKTKNPPVNYFLKDWSILCREKGKFLASERLLEKAEQLDESRSVDLEIQLERGRAALASGNLKKARAAYNKLVFMFKTHEHVLFENYASLLEGEILFSEGNFESALERLETLTSRIKTIKILGDLQYNTFIALGKTLVALKKFDEGLFWLRESLNLSIIQEAPFKKGIALFEIAKAVQKDKGFTENVFTLLEEAETIFTRLQLNHLLREIKEMLTVHNNQTRQEKEKDDQYLAGLTQVSQLIKDLKSKHLEMKDFRSGLPVRYLDGLKKLSELINYRLGQENFMGDLLEIVLELTSATRGVVFITGGGKLHPVASKLIDEATSQEAQRISETVSNELERERVPIYSPDATRDARFDRAQSILLNEIRSLLCIPLRTKESLVGTIYVDSPEPGLFDENNTLYFEAVGNILAATIERSLEFKRLGEDLALLRARHVFNKSGIVIGSSPAALRISERIERIALSNTNILLEGETGSGKGVFARLIHDLSERKGREFCSINCGVLPESIMESELFGSKKGAFTGATQDRTGLLEAADRSTVFFDEITNTSPAMQAKLLEVIEERVIRRVGDSKNKKVDLRFIFATNRDLESEVHAGRFREDLFFRISTMTIRIPPLRERKEDIPEYVDFFLKKFSSEFNKEIKTIDDDSLGLLTGYSWPGNVRELRNVIERSVLLAAGDRISTDDLKQHLPASPRENRWISANTTTAAVDLDMEKATRRLEKSLIEEALARYKTIEKAAAALGISTRSLWRKKKELKG